MISKGNHFFLSANATLKKTILYSQKTLLLKKLYLFDSQILDLFYRMLFYFAFVLYRTMLSLLNISGKKDSAFYPLN